MNEEFEKVKITIKGDDRSHVIQVPTDLTTEARNLYIHEAIKVLIRQHHDDVFLEKAKLRDLMESMTIKLDNAEGRTSPPVVAEFLILWLAPKKSAQAFLGDLQEMFERNLSRFGEKQARRKYWMEVGRSVTPFLWHWLKRIGFLSLLVDYFRAKFGL